MHLPGSAITIIMAIMRNAEVTELFEKLLKRAGSGESCLIPVVEPCAMRAMKQRLWRYMKSRGEACPKVSLKITNKGLVVGPIPGLKELERALK